MYFAGFRQINRVFMQTDHGFEKYQLQKKVIFQKLVVKIKKKKKRKEKKKKEIAHQLREITNFTDFWWKGNVST